jgi:histidyl-tRNA synthetase
MKLQTARGVKDLSPEEKIVKNNVVNTLQEVFNLYGFAPLETPLIERIETLSAKEAAGEESDVMKEVFKLTDQGKRKLGLRFDLTVPLARYVATNSALKLPFKRSQVGRVFRDGPIKLGRTREFWQMDVDTVGTKSMIAEAELLALANTAFTKLGMNVVIKVNNRKILNGILEQSGIKEKENAIIVIDKLAKIGKTGVEKELRERGYSSKQIKSIFSIIKEKTTFADLKKSVTTDLGKEGIAEMQDVLDYCRSMGIKTIQYEVSLARGLAYYTGTVFEVFLKKGEITSSIAAGGRYDDMVGKFMGGGRIIPAVGISFGLVPIVESLKKEGKKTPARLLVLPINTIKESLQIAEEFRSNGIETDFAMGKKGVSKNLQYADSLGIPFVAIIGEKELSKKKVLLRNMQTGDEQLLSVSQAVKKL